jgi:hypothetical protein
MERDAAHFKQKKKHLQHAFFLSFCTLAFLGSHPHPSAVSAERQNEITCAKQKDKAA